MNAKNTSPEPPTPTGDAWVDHLIDVEFKRHAGRHKSARRRFTAEEVKHIRKLAKTESQRSIARRMDISQATIGRIVRDVAYTGVK